MDAVGTHLLLDLRRCDAKLLDDARYIRESLTLAAEAAGATVLGAHFHKFSPMGVTGVVLISESHLCIHTWPERGYAAADIFTCGSAFQAQEAAGVIIDRLDCREPSITRLERGVSRQPQSATAKSMSTIELPPGRWHSESITPDLYQAERIEHVVFEAQSPFQKIEIHDGHAFGRALILDGKTQSTTADEFVYHESLVQPPMVSHAGPKSVFVAGGGEGATIREALAHNTVERVTMVDIDREVVEACRRHLPAHHMGAFEDPRLELHFEDAVAYLEQTDARYDVIIVDVSDPLEAGPAVMLYTREFHELVRDRLLPGGIAATHAGPTGPEFYEQCFSAIVSTMEAVFPITVPGESFIPSFGSEWGFVAGSLGPDPRTLTAEEIDRRIAERVSHPLRFYDGITQRGMTSLPKYLREALRAETRIITRDDPIFVE